MHAVLSSGVVVLLGAISARADGPSSALRGSASQENLASVEEGATLDALSDVFFSLAAGSEDASSEPFDNSTGSLSLSAMVEMEKRCSQGWSGLVETVAPGCVGQCAKYGICKSIGEVIKVWSGTHSKDKAKAKACESKRAFDCLLWSSHRKKCQPLIDRAPKFGIPANVNQACPRRLEETQTQDAAVAQPSELAQQSTTAGDNYDEAPALTAPENSGLPSEPISADQPSVQDAASDDDDYDECGKTALCGGVEPLALDSMVTAALSSNAQGCHCSTGELKQCGLQCFSRHSGSARSGCITDCLDKNHHSHSCSECYGRRSDCTMNKCLSKCAAQPDSKQCTDCVHSKCGGDCR